MGDVLKETALSGEELACLVLLFLDQAERGVARMDAILQQRLLDEAGSLQERGKLRSPWFAADRDPVTVQITSAVARLDAIMSTGSQPPSARAADIVLATMRKARRAS